MVHRLIIRFGKVAMITSTQYTWHFYSTAIRLNCSSFSPMESQLRNERIGKNHKSLDIQIMYKVERQRAKLMESLKLHVTEVRVIFHSTMEGP